MKKYGILTLKVVLWLVGSLIFLVLLTFLLIRVPAVQNFVLQKTVHYLEGKLKTKVEINRITLDLPKLLVLEDVYFEDQKRDTLLAGDTLKVDISLFKLLHNEVEINEIDLRGVTVNVQRTLPDSAFNFDYILKAFVSDQKKEPLPSDTTSTMKFSIHKINLDRIKASYRDDVMRSDMTMDLGHFDTDVKEFDPDKMKFSIPDIKLSGLNVRMVQSKPVAKTESYAHDSIAATQPFNMDLKLGKIALDRIRLYYQNDISGVKSNVAFEKLDAVSDLIDMKNQRIALKSVGLQNSNILFRLEKTQQAKVVARETAKEVKLQAQNWQVSVNDLNLQNNNILFDNFNMPVQKRGLDYGHMEIKGLNFKTSNFLYATDSISGKIGEANFRDKSGFELKSLRANFFYGPHRVALDDLYLQTTNTLIKDNIRLSYSSLEEISKNIGELGIDANLINSKLGLRDVLLLMPDLATTEPFKSNQNSSFNINGRVSGKVNNLNIPNMQVTGLSNTRIRVFGTIKGLPDPKKTYYNITIREFNSGRRDLNALIPKNMMPANVRLPESVNVSGSFKGSATNFTTNLSLRSSFGNAKAIGGMKGESFNADLQLADFHVGQLIKQDTMIGRVTASAKIAGTGLDPKKMNAKFSANVQRAELKGYPYQNFGLDGNIAGQNITTTASINDPNIKLDVDLKANIANTYPAVSFTLNVDSADLRALKLYNKELLFRGKLKGDLSSTDPDNLIGRVDASNLLIASDGKRYQLDSLNVLASANGDQRSLRLHSEFITAEISGKYTLTEVGNALTNEVNKYFKIGDGKALPVKNAQEFKFSLHVINNPVFQQFVPELTKMDAADLSGDFNSTTGTFNLKGNVPQLTYMGYSLNNLLLNANTGGGALNYSANLDEVSSSSLRINQTALSGKAQNNMLNVDLNVKDSGGKEQYRLAGLFSVLQDQYQFKFNNDGLVLNYEPWAVSADNSLQFGPKGIIAQNFGLSHSGQQLTITSNPPALNAPLAVTFTNFRIETLTSIAKKDSLLAGGVINGKALISNFDKSPVFTADLNIQDFNFMTDTVGNIALQVNNSQANTYAANAQITGKGNDVIMKGFYYVKDSGPGSFDLDLDINKINLESIQGFTMGNMRQARGSINGNLKITGTPSAPSIRGDVNFDQAGFNVAMLNSFYQIPHDKISFTEEGISMNNFTLLDSAGNEAVMNGKIYTKNFLDYRFAMTLQADNFKALSSTKKQNDLFYGDVVVSSSLNIEGDMNKPVVTGKVRIGDKTNFTVVLPQNDPAVQEREGIVEFVNIDDPGYTAAFKDVNLDSLKKSEIKGLDVSMNIEVDSTAVFNIVIDEGNGDFVKVQGQAQLSAGIDPSGKISLTGNYVLSNGAYEMSYNFIKRRFEIQRGSTITWTGEPTAATLDVNAIYVADTAPLSLVDNQLGSVSATERNRYKQKLPFEVYLTLKGELLKPEISFDIDLPAERNYNVARDVITVVNTRLDQLKADPNELNKQVFSLLLLNRFTSENPFDNEAGGGGVETFVRQSVSRILTDQLNNLAGNLIEGVDLNFDLVSSEDYTSGSLKQRTDLNVGLSRQLLNDRLKVTIGSNFELEGPQQSNQPANSIAGNIALDYQLSRDGRYLLRAYRKNVTDAVIEGYVIETGIGFIISMDYNKFKELFLKRTQEDKFIKKENRRERKLKKKEDKQIPATDA